MYLGSLWRPAMRTSPSRDRGCIGTCFAACAWAAILLLRSPPSSAQLSSASVNGTIRDQKSAVIPGATVVLHNVDTNVDHQAESNGSGAYAILNLVPGNYTLEARAAGFSPQKIEKFVLAVDQIATFDFTLNVGSTTEVVNVDAAAAQLDVTS